MPIKIKVSGGVTRMAKTSKKKRAVSLPTRSLSMPLRALINFIRIYCREPYPSRK